MTSPQPDQIVLAYQQQTQSLRDQIEAFIRALWASLVVYRAPQMTDFGRQVTPVVLGGQRQMVCLTSAYLAEYQKSRLVAPDPVKFTGAAARNGAKPVDVYERPFHLVWRQLNDLPREPGSVEKAIDAGLNRAINLAHTDLQLSKVQTSQELMKTASNVTGYRRVLEGKHSCGLCIVAATLHYHKAKLLPIHGGCDCSVEPLIGDTAATVTAVGRQGDELVPVGELEDIHDAIAARFGQSSPSARLIPGQGDLLYKDVLVEHRHGELGPVLGIRGQSFLGPCDL